MTKSVCTKRVYTMTLVLLPGGHREREMDSGPPKKPMPGAPSAEEIELPADVTVPRRKLGTTGVEVSAIGLGGFHIGLQKDDQTAIGLVRAAVDYGVTFMDNCWDYNDGKSHARMGRAL